jgi:hypothetical protein
VANCNRRAASASACGTGRTAYTKHVRRTNDTQGGCTLSMKLRVPAGSPQAHSPLIPRAWRVSVRGVVLARPQAGCWANGVKCARIRTDATMRASRRHLLQARLILPAILCFERAVADAFPSAADRPRLPPPPTRRCCCGQTHRGDHVGGQPLNGVHSVRVTERGTLGACRNQASTWRLPW